MFERIDSLFSRVAAKRKVLGTFLHAEVVAQVNAHLAKKHPLLAPSVKATHIKDTVLTLTATSGPAAQEARTLLPELYRITAHCQSAPKTIRIELRSAPSAPIRQRDTSL